MLRQARAAGGRRVGLRLGRAEALPFKDAWFERAVLRTVVHLIERARAFPELARVLRPGGLAVIATFAPEHFASDWLVPFFPRVAEIDRGRFPTRATLESELAAAGFGRVRVRTLEQRASLAREDALERIRERFISTLRLLDDEAFEQGLAHAERKLPDSIERTNHWVVLVAERG